MQQFKDSADRDWSVEVNVAAVKRVRSMLGGLDLLDPKVFNRLADDPVQLVDVLYVLCKPQADEKGITDEQFGRSMAGDALGRATDALLQEIVDFFHGGKRLVMSKVLQKSKTLLDAATAAATEKIESLTLADLMKSSGGLPGSPE